MIPCGQKKKPEPTEPPKYEDIHLPANTPIPVYIGILSFTYGFATTWYMHWLGTICFLGLIACIMVRLCGKDKHKTITAAEVKKIEEENRMRPEHA